MSSHQQLVHDKLTCPFLALALLWTKISCFFTVPKYNPGLMCNWYLDLYNPNPEN